MSTEHVLIWPKEYPLLLKGLLEQNGAFILDALEAWPNCESVTDDKQITSTVLPPLYYLLWQKPSDPFEHCFFQHIVEFNDELRSYIENAQQHLLDQLGNKEAVSELLISRIEQYASTQEQIKINVNFSLTKVCKQLRYFKIFQYVLEHGLRINNEDALSLWQDDDFRAIALPFIESGNHLSSADTLADIVTQRLRDGEDYFDLLLAIKSTDIDTHILEKALLAHITSIDAKQGICSRFVEQGAIGELLDDDGMNAAMWAAKNGFASVLASLLNKDNINAQDHKGNTALHYAVLSKNEACLSIVLNAGVNFSIKNKAGLSAYRLAVTEKLSSVVAQFEKKFGIKELSEAQQYNWIRRVHSLHAAIIFLLPVQLFFIFSEGLSAKSEICFLISLTSMIMMFYALTIRKSPLYPSRRHPVSLSLLRILSPFAIAAQLLVSGVIVVSVLS